MIEVRVDASSAWRFLGDAKDKAAAAALKRSMGRTIKGVSLEAGKQVRSRKLVKLTAKEVRQRLKIVSSFPGTYIPGYYSAMQFGVGKIGLARYQSRRSLAKRRGAKRYYRERVTVMGKTFVAGRGFRKKFPSGKLVLLKREGKERLPLVRMWGPSLSDLAKYSGLATSLSSMAAERLSREFSRELRFRLSRLGRRSRAMG